MRGFSTIRVIFGSRPKILGSNGAIQVEFTSASSWSSDGFAFADERIAVSGQNLTVWSYFQQIVMRP